jgi:hypothetical protein
VRTVWGNPKLRSATQPTDQQPGPVTSAYDGQRTHLVLAQLVILTVIPPAPTRPSQTGLNRNATQPDLGRPNWTVENRRWAVIS